MVSQANSIEPDIEDHDSLRSVAQNSTEFAEDVVTLAELQAKLLMLETREWIQSLVRPVGFLAAGLVVALGLIPVMFLGIAAGLMQAASLSMAQALAFSILIGIVLSAVLLLSAYFSIAIKTPFFECTKKEWSSNFKWFRNMVRRQGRRW